MNARSSGDSSRRSFLPYAAGALLLLGVLFYAFPRNAPERSSSPAGLRSFNLVIEQNRLVSEPAVIRAHEGDDVVLDVVSDSSDEFHLHGYDLKLPLSPGTPATLRFTADRVGRFEYELEKSHVELGALEVHPR